MKTPWILSIVNCSGITSSSTPLELVQPRSARASWKMLHWSGELSFTTPPWLTSRKSSMPSIPCRPTFMKLGSSLVSVVIKTGVPGERHTYKATWVTLDDEDHPSSESLGMLDLERYEDSDREVLFNHQNMPSSSNPRCQSQEAHMYPFSPQ